MEIDYFTIIIGLAAFAFSFLAGSASGYKKGFVRGASSYRNYIIHETQKILKGKSVEDDKEI